MKFVLMILALVACTSRPPKDPGPSGKNSKSVSIESKQLASEEETTFVTEVSFPKKKAMVSKTARKELQHLYEKAHRQGKIDKVQIITWGDLEYPSVHEKELSKEQKKLAQKRNTNVEKILLDLDQDLSINKISMAERPNALKELVSSDEAEVKKSLETSGLPNTDTSVKVPGKASRSIVIFILDR